MNKPIPTSEQALALARYWAGDEQPGDVKVVTRFEIGGMSEAQYIAGALARYVLQSQPKDTNVVASDTAEWLGWLS